MKVTTAASISALTWACGTFALTPGRAAAQTTPTAEPSTELAEIVVTAQKREQTIQSVPMSIQTASGDVLTDQGVKSTGDLTRIIPGFNGADNTGFDGAPTYAIRGVGYHDPSLAANPTVSVYNDQIPLPFSIETVGSILDLQRVEVLKGPQGTLFGDNSTGGAINYIANKPTDHFEAGGDLQYGRFNTVDGQGYVSGPLTDTLDARLAVRTIQADGWQQNYINGATLGARNFTTARLTLDWEPASDLHVMVTLTGFDDKSQSVAPQFEGIQTLSSNSSLPAGLLSFPIAPHNDRAAAFPACINDSPTDTHCVGYDRNNKLYLGSLRVDYDLATDITLTSLTSYEKLTQYQPFSEDGTTYQDFQSINTGHLDTTFQELRLAGNFSGRGAWMVGGNFQRDDTAQGVANTIADSSAGTLIGIPVVGTHVTIAGITDTYAGFVHTEYPVLSELTLEGGLRFTQSNQSFAGCERDNGNGRFALVDQILQNFFQTGTAAGPGINPGPGGCTTLSGPPSFIPELAHDNLDENNVSFRVGANWKAQDDVMLYANVSRGYKAGAFSGLTASEAYQYQPARQERLIAYETGFKSELLEHTLQLNGAAFYYDYNNKQIQGNVTDIFFGALPQLINIPKSHVAGFELSTIWKPVSGLTLAPMVSYAHSQIDGNFYTINYLGQNQLMSGRRFPGDPELQADVDAQYEWPLSGTMSAFVGTNVSYQGTDNSLLGDLPGGHVPGYTLVDVRGGVERGALRLELWGRNVLDRYYYITQLHVNDVYARYTGMPATYGLTLSYRLK
jgi:iron complex outermembrane recepter protein